MIAYACWSIIKRMETPYLQRHGVLRDIIGLVIFVVAVVIGTIFINNYLFRSFSVDGPSMETTMYTGDRLIVNRIPVTTSQIKNQEYVPERGQVIVFKNPRIGLGSGEEYIVKRVIGLPGERVVVKDGKITVYNEENPNGFNPDDAYAKDITTSTSGEVDQTVAEGTLFVVGDHREGNFSYDSRNGLGLIPFYDVIGPVGFRIFPLNKIRGF